MASETEILLEAKLIATQFLLSKVLTWALKDLDDASFESLAEDYHQNVGSVPFFGLDPSLSDHISAEIRDEVERVMSSVRTMRQQRK